MAAPIVESGILASLKQVAKVEYAKLALAGVFGFGAPLVISKCVHYLFQYANQIIDTRMFWDPICILEVKSSLLKKRQSLILD